MAGKDVSAVLDAQLPLDEAFHEVAPRAEDDDDECEAHPSQQWHRLGLPAPDDVCGGKGEETAADAACPRLPWRDAREELVGNVSSERASAEVGKGVVDPEEDEEGQGVYPVVGQGTRRGIIDDAQEGQQCEGDGNVELRGKAERPVAQGGMGFAVELADENVEEQHPVEREHLGSLRAGNAAEPCGSDEYDSGHCVDRAGQAGSCVAVHQRAELPQRCCCDEGEEEEGADGTIDGAPYEQQHIDGSGQGADYQISHLMD